MTSDVAADLIQYLRRSPSPFHACASTAHDLRGAGFRPVREDAEFPAEPGNYYLVRGGSLVAWSTTGAGDDPTVPFRVVGAHTDSPNLRIKPRPNVSRVGMAQLGVEVYGGPLLNSWLDRDLGLSGRVAVRGSAVDEKSADDSDVVALPEGLDPAGVRTVLLHLDEPLLRVAQLAIHLDRAVNTEGVKLNPQQHLAPIWGLEHDTPDFCSYLARVIGVAPDDVLGWDLMTHDVQPPARIGLHGEFVASGRLDNLATCYAGTRALISAVEQRTSSREGGPAAGEGHIPVLVMFDHEEVGSVSERGAQSDLLPTVLERITLSRNGSRSELHRAMARTIIASGDMAHATHPNYAERHEPEHRIAIDAGPVLKVNNQLRYATGAPGAAAFHLACEQAGVPLQRFVTRSDLPCGSTVGPMTAARTGAQTVDFGAPMLSMHSARELVGVRDMEMYVAALGAFLAGPR